jgi:hypothetical protein
MTKPEAPPRIDEVTIARIEADLSGIEFREPVVDNAELYERLPSETIEGWTQRSRGLDIAEKAKDSEVDHQWKMVTESIRRRVGTDTEVRSILTDFVAEPLSEGLPLEVVSAVAEQEGKVARTARISKGLGLVLKLDSVPDEIITPDITNAPHLKRKSQKAKSLESTIEYGDDYQSSLDRIRESVTKWPGITPQERKLIARRYRYARDVKILGFMAELHDQPFEGDVSPDGLLHHSLNSGVRLTISAEAHTAFPDLLNPEVWESRKQLKDRVHAVTVNDKEFIMKERKTPRHTDVKKHGHKDGARSSEEFESAREFAGLGSVAVDPDMDVFWEKPLGYVEFPDGFEFCMFESVPGLIINSEYARHILISEIRKHPETFQEEFERIRKRAEVLYAENPKFKKGSSIDSYHVESRKPKRFPMLPNTRQHKKKYDKFEKELAELTFDDFAEVKASVLMEESRIVLAKTIAERGYINSDFDGYGYRVLEGERPRLQIIGFDFEYYKKNPERAATMQANGRKFHGDINESFGWKQAGQKGISRAAQFALLEDSIARVFGEDTEHQVK